MYMIVLSLTYVATLDNIANIEGDFLLQKCLLGVLPCLVPPMDDDYWSSSWRMKDTINEELFLETFLDVKSFIDEMLLLVRGNEEFYGESLLMIKGFLENLMKKGKSKNKIKSLKESKRLEEVGKIIFLVLLFLSMSKYLGKSILILLVFKLMNQ